VSRAVTRIAAMLVVSTLAGLGLGVVYVLGGQPQWEGALLAVSLGGIGLALVLWAKALFGEAEEVGERTVLPSEPEPRAEFVTTLERGGEVFARRHVLVRLLAAAGGALGLAALFPLRSLGPPARRQLFHTAWRPGSRLVTEAGEPIRVDQLPVGGILTVFPEGRVDADDSATLLIRVEPGALRPRPGREEWSPDGNVAYSKLCTHVGCPVGLYRETTHELLCPCHQSTFDVLDGARPVFGPATRSLPQLPLAVDRDGYLVAVDDFPDPVGPGFWNMGR